MNVKGMKLFIIQVIISQYLFFKFEEVGSPSITTPSVITILSDSTIYLSKPHPIVIHYDVNYKDFYIFKGGFVRINKDFAILEAIIEKKRKYIKYYGTK